MGVSYTEGGWTVGEKERRERANGTDAQSGAKSGGHSEKNLTKDKTIVKTFARRTGSCKLVT